MRVGHEQRRAGVTHALQHCQREEQQHAPRDPEGGVVALPGEEAEPGTDGQRGEPDHEVEQRAPADLERLVLDAVVLERLETLGAHGHHLILR